MYGVPGTKHADCARNNRVDLCQAQNRQIVPGTPLPSLAQSHRFVPGSKTLNRAWLKTTNLTLAQTTPIEPGTLNQTTPQPTKIPNQTGNSDIISRENTRNAVETTSFGGDFLPAHYEKFPNVIESEKNCNRFYQRSLIKYKITIFHKF